MTDNKEGFLEQAAKISGANESEIEEAKKLDVVDQADVETEKTFAKGRRSEDSPINRAVFGKEFPFELFDCDPSPRTDRSAELIDKIIKVVRSHREAGTLFDKKGKVSKKVEKDLANVGYWGLLIPEENGGSELSFSEFSDVLRELATIDATVAGLGSVHGCIGAVDPLIHFPPEDSKVQTEYLKKLASGERLSAFALTEQGAGSDLTAIKTEAVLDGDHYVVNGRKLFITNANYGRTVGLVCKIDGKPEVLIADLPKEDSENFKIHTYGLWALVHANNVGLEFNNFKVPKENLLIVRDEEGNRIPGRGLIVAYHGLNRGRVALCANASGAMRALLADCIPWAKFRVTYNRAIADRQLVQKRVGEMVSLMVGCDALTEWCAAQLDDGFRGEMECIIAKRFGSESMKHSAIEYIMKTHGGRSFLQGHMFGDNLHDYLAPCIYEGEGEMLSQKFFGTLIKEQQNKFFLPIAMKVKELQDAGKMAGKFNPVNPWHAWMMRSVLTPFTLWIVSRSAWLFGQKVKGLFGARFPELNWMPKRLRNHASYAAAKLQERSVPMSIITAMLQNRLLEEQCFLAKMSEEVQDLVIIASTSIWAARKGDPTTSLAADILCENLRFGIEGNKPKTLRGFIWYIKHFGKRARLGKMVLEGKFDVLDGLQSGQILQRYEG